MPINNLEILLIKILDCKTYDADNSIIKETLNLVKKLSVEDKITHDLLNKINENIKYLDQKYDDLYELVNLFDPICFYYENLLKKNYTYFLRKQNREKKNGVQ